MRGASSRGNAGRHRSKQEASIRVERPAVMGGTIMETYSREPENDLLEIQIQVSPHGDRPAREFARRYRRLAVE